MRAPAISAIAWPKELDAAAVARAASLGFRGIEIAPVKQFGPLAEAAPAAIARHRAWLAEAGLAVPALQGILFGVPGLHLFRDEEARARLASALRQVARVAGLLGAHACVFGAPGLRDPGDLPPDAAFDIAARFLSALAPAFEAEGSALAIEPVPEGYGNRFLLTTAEAAALVRAVARPGIRLQLDTGTLLANAEDPAAALATPQAVHLHVSEPGLAPVGGGGADHAALGHALRASPYRGWLSVEMRPAADPLAAIEAAWRCLAAHYLEPKA